MARLSNLDKAIAVLQGQIDDIQIKVDLLTTEIASRKLAIAHMNAQRPAPKPQPDPVVPITTREDQ